MNTFLSEDPQPSQASESRIDVVDVLPEVVSTRQLAH